MKNILSLTAFLFLATSFAQQTLAQKEKEMPARPPERPYTGDLASYPGPWSFQIGKSAIILVSDKELEALSDPEKVINLTLTYQKEEGSLKQVCERAKAAGHQTLILAFDHFFSQYRPGQAGPRKLTPDMDEYVNRIASISKFAQKYGLGLELSLLSPLEIGPAYERQTGESGVWMHYREGLRDPKTGLYSVQLWRQLEWVNNKGPISIKDAGVRVFAFHETPISGTSYRVVDPSKIVEISDTAKVELMGDPQGSPTKQRVRIYGQGHADLSGLDRVMVVQMYQTPEMDYFSPKALPYLEGLIDKYAKAGVKLNGLYSDEMHIQQDWSYFGHHDEGQFALRYASPGIAAKYAELYGPEYKDFVKYSVFFCTGQEDFAGDLSAHENTMHVFGSSPEEIRRTALFRSRYFHLLQNGVVDLFATAKRYAEVKMNHRLESRAHATWAESPTIDDWRTGQQNMYKSAYDYTSNFVWSNTVHQASSACADYFKWGDFLTGNGNDHCECGWLDRNYYGLSLACSTGILNDVPYSYGAHWGMPAELSRRRTSLVNVFGAAGSPLFGLVEDMQHRDVDVLMLYPLDLVAVDERFGSWMTQYAYANLITPEILVERGKVVNGHIEIAGRKFTTLVALFEPFPDPKLLDMMRELADQGGKVVWSGPPPVLSPQGNEILPEWETLFGVEYKPGQNEGVMAPGRIVDFEGTLKSVPPQEILTDFLVDRIYPVTPVTGTSVVAKSGTIDIGTLKTTAKQGSLVVLGFRPRDDQSQSLGYEARTWFETLKAIGAYPSVTGGEAFNDNTENISRTTDYLACRFPNGTVAMARHFRLTEEDWDGGFARNQARDADYLKRVPPPSEAIDLHDFKVNGHTINYTGTQAVAFRVNEQKQLVAFAGSGSRKIMVDGVETVFADADVSQIAFGSVEPNRRVKNGALMQMMVYGTGTIRLPAFGLPEKTAIVAEGPTLGSRGAVVPSHRENGAIVFEVTQALSGRWLFAVPE